jgi:hypothetical protein
MLCYNIFDSIEVLIPIKRFGISKMKNKILILVILLL